MTNAFEILDKIKIIDPHAVIAGGAARDWYFGNDARDIDIYYRGIKGLSCPGRVSQLAVLGFDGVKHLTGGEEYNDAMNSFLWAYEWRGDDIVVNFIAVTCFPENVIDEFTCNICQAYAAPSINGCFIYGSEKFKQAIDTNTIVCAKKDYPHTKKMVERFGSKFNIVFGDTLEIKQAIGLDKISDI